MKKKFNKKIFFALILILVTSIILCHRPNWPFPTYTIKTDWMNYTIKTDGMNYWAVHSNKVLWNSTNARLTFQNVLNEGGTILVNSGTYEFEVVKLPSGYWGSLFVSKDGTKIVGEKNTILICSSHPFTANRFIQINASYVTLKDFTIDLRSTPVSSGTGSAVSFTSGAHEEFHAENLRIFNVPRTAIGVHCNKSKVINCYIDNVWTGITAARSHDVIIKGNEISNTGGDGIFPRDACKNVTIEYNTIENIGDTGIDITSSSDVPPHENIVARFNTLKNASIRVAKAQHIDLFRNTIENGWILVDVHAGERSVGVKVERNDILSDKHAGIAFRGAANSFAINNMIRMVPVEGVNQSGINVAIWGTGLIEGNTIINPANCGIDFAGWGLGGGSNITIRRNIILDFHDIGIYDNAKKQGGFLLIENNILEDRNEPFVSRYGIRTDYEKNKWIIRGNQVYAGRLDFISAPGSDIYDNIYQT